MSKKKFQEIIPPDDLINHAENLDREARRLWTEMDMHITAAEIISIPFGKVCQEMKDQALHKMVRKAHSRKGYPSFPEWVESVTNGKLSSSSLYMAMGLHRLTEGPNAIPAEEIVQMPKENAYRLSTQLTPEQRTPEMIEKAKKTTKEEFPKRIQEKLNEGLPADKQVVIRVEFFRQWAPDVVNKLEATIERFTHLPIVRDHNRELTLQEKAVLAICFAAESDCDLLLKQAEAEHSAEIELPEAKEAVAETNEAVEADGDQTESDMEDLEAANGDTFAEGDIVEQEEFHETRRVVPLEEVES
jgi:hypothetical protein